MRKKLLVLLGLLLTLITLPTAIKPAQAYIEEFTWLPPYALRGYDYNLGTYVVAYTDGSTVDLAVPVFNDAYSWGFNVSKVILNFYGLGVNKTYDISTSPEKITYGNTKVYTISFVADAAEFLNGAQAHEYRIIVENVNSTTTPRKQWSPWIVYYYYWSSYEFVVYTTEQSDVIDLSQEYYAYENNYPWYYFDSIEAEHLAFDATVKGDLGSLAIQRGDYASAKTYFEAAIDLYKQALTAEQDYWKADEDADLNESLTRNAAIMIGANANMTWAEADMTRANAEAEAAVIAANGTRLQGEAALMNANGFFAIGIGFAIGWSLIGVGVIIYAFKRPKPPT
jgi:tetratricopeptide (TPR) repeat protein